MPKVQLWSVSCISMTVERISAGKMRILLLVLRAYKYTAQFDVGMSSVGESLINARVAVLQIGR